jgi:cation transport regulator
VPYRSLDELPQNVKSVLPGQAREEYRKPADRRGDSSREEVARDAVKQQYEKAGAVWKRKDRQPGLQPGRPQQRNTE